MHQDELTKAASVSLGDSTSYAVYTDQYDPSLLNPMPRKPGRDQNGISLVMSGVDVWHCHEATFLTDRGLPVAGRLKFSYPSSTINMIESKSMKLYLNSFDMCRMGPTVEEATRNYVDTITENLADAIGADLDEVKVAFIPDRAGHSILDITGFQNLGHLDYSNTKFEDFTGQKQWIRALSIASPSRHRFYTNALRSRCRHTKQKDTGAALIQIDSQYAIDPRSVMKQIVSLREKNEFHEFCAEIIVESIAQAVGAEQRPEPFSIDVALLYARRGSLDINPIRSFRLNTTADEDPGSIFNKYARPDTYMILD